MFAIHISGHRLALPSGLQRTTGRCCLVCRQPKKDCSVRLQRETSKEFYQRLAIIVSRLQLRHRWSWVCQHHQSLIVLSENHGTMATVGTSRIKWNYAKQLFYVCLTKKGNHGTLYALVKIKIPLSTLTFRRWSWLTKIQSWEVRTGYILTFEIFMSICNSFDFISILARLFVSLLVGDVDMTGAPILPDFVSMLFRRMRQIFR